VLRAFLEADAAMRESPHPRVELEIATVRSTRRPVPQALDDVLRRVDEAQREIRQQALATPSAPARRRRRSPGGLGARARPRRSAPARSGRPSAAPPSRRRPPRAPPRPRRPRRAAAGCAGASTRAGSAHGGRGAAGSGSGDGVGAGRGRSHEEEADLGGVLTQARPSGVTDRELTIVLHGNHFHREMLSDVANRELVVQAVRRCVAGAERLNVVSGGEAAGTIATHRRSRRRSPNFRARWSRCGALPEGEGQ